MLFEANSVVNMHWNYKSSDKNSIEEGNTNEEESINEEGNTIEEESIIKEGKTIEQESIWKSWRIIAALFVIHFFEVKVWL